MKKLSLIFLMLVVLVGGDAWGETYYVSPTGNDDAAGAMGTPWATLGKAVTVASDGDIVWFANGTYNTQDGANGTTTVRIQNSVAWKATNQGQVVWKANSTDMVVYAQPSNLKTPEINGIVIDATGGSLQAASCMVLDAATTGTITLTNVTLKNFTVHGFVGNKDSYNFIVNGLTLQALNNSGMGISITSNTTGTITINGVIFDLTSNANYSTYYGIYYSPATAPTGVVTISGATGTITTSHANAVTKGIYLRNAINAVIGPDNNITIIAASAQNNKGIEVVNTGETLVATAPTIFNNDITTNFTVGSAIRVGSDLTPSDGTQAGNKSNNAKIYGNTVTSLLENGQISTPHGIVLAYNTGGKIYKNTIENFSPGILMTGTDANTIAHHNVVKKSYGDQSLYFKGATGSIYANNTVYMETGHSGKAFAVATNVDPDPDVVCDSVKYINNIVYNSAASPVFVKVNASNTAVFSNNLYYAVGDLISTSWSYQASNYATFNDWKSGQETDAFGGDPLFTSTTDFHLQPGSPCVKSGVFVTGVHDQPSPNNVDLGGLEFNSMWMPIGAYGRRCATASP